MNCAQLEMEADSVGGRLWRMVESDVVHGRYISAEETIAKLGALERRSISQLIEQWWSEQSWMLVLCGDVDGFDAGDAVRSICTDEQQKQGAE